MKKYKPYVVKLPHQAAYGLYLMQLCKEADEMGEKLGRFVEIYIPTLEEFIEMRTMFNKRRSGFPEGK